MIVTIGSINIDMTANVPRLPGPGETIQGTGFSTAPGGKGANQALASRRAGAEVMMAGAVGKDPFADSALALLKAGGVDLTRVKETSAPTGTAIIMVSGDGENVIAIIPGANMEVNSDQFGDLPFAKGDVILLQLEIGIDTVKAAIAKARVYGALTVLNIAPFNIAGVAMMADADITIANETEFEQASTAMALVGATLQEKMQGFVTRTGRTIIVTLGGDGVVAATGTGFHQVPALKVTPVDTVGAGDTFTAGLICRLLEFAVDSPLALGQLDSAQWKHVLAFAAGVAALNCTRAGCDPPMRAEMDPSV